MNIRGKEILILFKNNLGRLLILLKIKLKSGWRNMEM